MAVARYWDHEGFVIPFYGPEVDLRIVRASDAIRKEVHGGYSMGYAQVSHMLADVTYLGWRLRGGQVTIDGAQTRIEPDLFWFTSPTSVGPLPASR